MTEMAGKCYVIHRRHKNKKCLSFVYARAPEQLALVTFSVARANMTETLIWRDMTEILIGSNTTEILTQVQYTCK